MLWKFQFSAFALLSGATFAASLPDLLPRGEIFSKLADIRPAISASGQWIATSNSAGNAVTLMSTSQPGLASVEIPLLEMRRLYWYRWADGQGDRLLVAGGSDDGDLLFRYDVKARQLVRVTTPDDQPRMLFASPTNLYAFTYERFANQTIRKYRQLARKGKLVVVDTKNSAWERAENGAESFLNIAMTKDGTVLTYGLDKDRRQTFDLNAGDRRTKGALVSIAPSGFAYVLSMNGLDTMGLHELNLHTGRHRVLAAEPTFPTIVDRAPNDRYWMVKFAHGAGVPKWAIYDKTRRSLRLVDLGRLPYRDTANWRASEIKIARVDEPTIPRVATRIHQ